MAPDKRQASDDIETADVEAQFTQAEKYKALADTEQLEEIHPPSSSEDLRGLRREGSAIKTSTGKLFGGENDVWTRDMAITAEDLLMVGRGEIAQEAILTLAQFQGVESVWNSGEKPGRMHTEHREIYNNEQLGLLTKLSLSAASGILWQNGWTEYTNYFSRDTTPLFIRTVSSYAEEHPEIMDCVVEKKDGSKDTIKESVIKAAEYIESTVSEDGLIRIKEENIPGDQYRYWRDSPNSYRDEKGQMPNIIDDMVILDIQALSAEALEEAAKLIEEDDIAKAERWSNLANKIREATIKHLWMEDEQYFAYGMDKKENGELRQIKAIQSNAGWLLYSDFFDHLPEDEREKYVTGIVNKLFSEELLTNAGVRCRAKKHMHDREFQDYHGAWVSWPVESYMIVKGLRKQGFDKLADQIETRIINAVNMSGVNYEFFVIDEEGRVLLDPNKEKNDDSESIPIEMKPENTIAWTVTATLRAKKERSDRWRAEHDPDHKPKERPEWVHGLEESILEEIGVMPIYKSTKEIQENRYDEPELYLDQKAGLKHAGKILYGPVGKAILTQKIRRLLRLEK